MSSTEMILNPQIGGGAAQARRDQALAARALKEGWQDHRPVDESSRLTRVCRSKRVELPSRVHMQYVLWGEWGEVVFQRRACGSRGAFLFSIFI